MLNKNKVRRGFQSCDVRQRGIFQVKQNSLFPTSFPNSLRETIQTLGGASETNRQLCATLSGLDRIEVNSLVAPTSDKSIFKTHESKKFEQFRRASNSRLENKRIGTGFDNNRLMQHNSLVLLKRNFENSKTKDVLTNSFFDRTTLTYDRSIETAQNLNQMMMEQEIFGHHKVYQDD